MGIHLYYINFSNTIKPQELFLWLFLIRSIQLCAKYHFQCEKDPLAKFMTNGSLLYCINFCYSIEPEEPSPWFYCNAKPVVVDVLPAKSSTATSNVSAAGLITSPLASTVNVTVLPSAAKTAAVIAGAVATNAASLNV